MLKIGTSLTIEPVHSDQEKYRCKVADIKEQLLFIDYPVNIQTDRTVFLLNSQPLHIVFIDETQSAYRFKTKVVGRLKEGEIPLIILEIPPENQMEKIQRRQFVRVDTAVDASLRFFGSNGHFSTVTADLSAGGCAVILQGSHSIIPDEEGEGLFVLPISPKEYHYLRIPFKVIREWESGGRRVASLQFTDIKEKTQQLLIRFCFVRQLKQKRKGLISG